MGTLVDEAGARIARRLRLERDARGWSQADLAERAGVSKATISKIERVSRFADQPLWRDPETGYLRRQVFSRPDHPLEIVEVEMPAGKRVTLPASSYAHIRQAVWVRTGELVIVEGGERHRLMAGDCLGFGPPCETTLANESAAPCVYVVVLARS